MYLQLFRVERIDDRFGEIARQPFGFERFLFRMPHHRMLAHLGTREINLLAFAIRAGDVALRRNVSHRAAERRMERVGVDREKDDLFFWHAALDCMTKNGVRQIPAQMDADHRIVELVFGRGQHALFVPRNRNSRSAFLLENRLQPVHDVVDV